MFPFFIVCLVSDFFIAVSADGLCSTLSHSATRVAPTTGGLSHEMQDRYEIERSELTFDVRLGHGNFGDVWKGRLTSLSYFLRG